MDGMCVCRGGTDSQATQNHEQQEGESLSTVGV